jgi:general stress protein YciG
MTTYQTASAASSDQSPPKPRRPRGFAAMSPERVREISRLGGKAAHQKGVAHEFTREEAQAAGRKGGLAAHQHDAIRSESTDHPSSPDAFQTERAVPEDEVREDEGESGGEKTPSKQQ